jgi:membrane-bound ClpP family serine protease
LPNTAFLLLIAGVLLIYCEFIWVSKIIFGTAGALSILTGLALFDRLPHTSFSLWLTLGGVACFVVETVTRTYFLASILGTALLACGFWRLGVAPLLVLPGTLACGALTSLLLSIARRARQNKLGV